MNITTFNILSNNKPNCTYFKIKDLEYGKLIFTVWFLYTFKVNCCSISGHRHPMFNIMFAKFESSRSYIFISLQS